MASGQRGGVRFRDGGSTDGTVETLRRFGDRWANITDPLLVLGYFLCLIPSLARDVVSFRKYKFVGMFMALERISEVMRERKTRKPHAFRSDREIIRCVKLRNGSGSGPHFLGLATQAY